jgi:hypothetical protein
LVAALCIPSGLALAQTPSEHSLPPGTRLDFVADDTINVEAVRAGGQYRVRLARALVLDGTPLAAAGTTARLIVTEKIRRADGSTELRVALAEFHLRQGELPLTPVTPGVSAVTAGMTISALTNGSVERIADRVVISVPVPGPLSTNPPNAAYSPIPVLTPRPLRPVPRRGASPTPLPTTFNPPDDAPSPD